MDYAIILLNQLLIMAIYIAIGYVLHKTKLVSTEGCKALANVLLYVILPCVIFNAFRREANAESTKTLLLALAVGAVLMLLSMGLSHLVFRKNPVDDFSASFSNAGFMGIPLITAALGGDSVFYIAGMVALLNILQWFYGQRLLVGDKSRLPILTVLKNPLVIAFGAGLLIYLLQLSLPKQIGSCVSAIAGCNAPVAMIILGFYLCEMPLSDLFRLPAAYAVSAVRLVLIPLLSCLLLAWIPGIQTEVKLALLIAASAPVGANVAVYARKLDRDYPRAVALICQSTIFCILTMPLLIAFFSWL